MIGPRPKFVDSIYFVDEPGNWHLKPGAPPEVVREFNDFINACKETQVEPEKCKYPHLSPLGK